ncbi:MAG TPA: DNA/RNA non-specific endonuclease [Vicinamibacterales bacterium]|jgi:endonuclease G
MSQAAKARERQFDRLHEVGARWQALTARRQDIVGRLRRGGPEAADAPARVRLYQDRETAKQLVFARAGVTATYFQERKIGPTLDLDEFPPNDVARAAGVPVGRIVELGDAGEALDGFATGFLVAAGLLITNHHVFGAAAECAGCGVQFGYELDADRKILNGPVFGLDADRFFYTNEALDCTIVAVAAVSSSAATPLASFGSHHLSPALGKILVGQTISIIQYPDGGPKKYGVRDNELLVPAEPNELYLQYTTDTLPGSSGSPAFNKDWEVVALHHSGVPEIRNGKILTIRGTPWTKGMPDSDIHWIANEGVRVSKICGALIDATPDPRFHDAWTDLVSTFQEDFTMLPAMTTPAGAPGTADAPPQGLSIVVNGPATFYIGATGADAVQAVTVSTSGAATAPAPAPPDAEEKKLVFDPNYAKRPGFKPDFLPVRIPLPSVAKARAGEILEAGGKPLLLKYHHFSLVMNKPHRLQMWSAVNADYTPAKRRKTRKQFGDETWVADPRIPGALQIEDQDLYDPAKKFDRGHIVSRDDTAWGETAQEEIYANSDSYHWTNATPQHEGFNRDVGQFHGLWGQLEDHIRSQAKNVGYRMSIFAGPILDDAHDIRHDFGGGPITVPARFWKVLMVTEEAASRKPQLRAYGFVLDQLPAIQKYGLEKFDAGSLKVYQVRLDDITKPSGVTFPKIVTAADAMAGAPDEARRIVIDSLDQVRL